MPVDKTSRNYSLLERMSIQHAHRQQRPEGGSHTHILNRRRVYILPTAHGLGMLFMLSVMLLGSVNYNNNLGYAFTFLIGCICTISILHTHRNLVSLKVSQPAPAAVYAGEMASIHFQLDPGRRKREAIRIELASGEYITGDLDTRNHELSIARKASRRGLHPVGRVKISTTWPFGLFIAWSWLEFTDSPQVVYPAPEQNPPPVSGSGSHGGSHPSKRHHGTDEFAGLRDYRRGDSPSHIAWKQASRSDIPPVKLFDEASQGIRWLDWYEMDDIGTEARLSRLARWIINANHRHDSFGLILPGTRIDPASGTQHMHECLRALAGFGYQV